MNRPIEHIRRDGGPVTLLHRGTSMHPVIRDGDVLDLEPVTLRDVRPGDVVAGIPAGETEIVVHRVVDIAANKILTRGDNIGWTDPWALEAGDIAGKVTTLRRGQRKLAVAGGIRGRLTGGVIRLFRRLKLLPGPAFRTSLHRLSDGGPLKFFLPESCRPRVVAFETPLGERRRLLVGNRDAGEFDSIKMKWRIRSRYRLFIDPGAIQMRRRNGQ